MRSGPAGALAGRIDEQAAMDVLIVLIVDDSRAMRRIERQVLSRLGGLEVHEAEDGVSAIYQLKALDFQVDLILVDWVMPRMDGITFVKMMKTSPNLSKIPILMVTSCSDEHMMGRAWETGVNGYLLKPFTKELFLQAILALGPTFSGLSPKHAGVAGSGGRARDDD